MSGYTAKRLCLSLALLLTSACLEKMAPIPQVPVVAGGGSCSDKHGVFIETGETGGSRANHTATLLTDGRVLFAGGYLSSGYVEYSLLDSSEIYDPSSGTFHDAGVMTSARSNA